MEEDMDEGQTQKGESWLYVYKKYVDFFFLFNLQSKEEQLFAHFFCALSGSTRLECARLRVLCLGRRRGVSQGGGEGFRGLHSTAFVCLMRLQCYVRPSLHILSHQSPTYVYSVLTIYCILNWIHTVTKRVTHFTHIVPPRNELKYHRTVPTAPQKTLRIKKAMYDV